MLTRSPHLLIAFLLSSVSASAEHRQWNDVSGNFSVEAELVRVGGANVVLRRTDGREISVPITRLSQPDRQYLQSLQTDDVPKVDGEIVTVLETVRAKHDLPAMSAAVVSSDGLIAHGVTGVRRRGAAIKAGPNDQWHLGSDTKAMTATLCVQLAAAGRLDLDAPISKVLPTARMHPQFQQVTLTQLLTHQSGLPANLDLPQYLGASGPRERVRAVQVELAKPPTFAPGSQAQYSNLGYIIAGAVVEKATGKSWQANMREHIFSPLGMTSAGFGGLGTPGKLDQPWPHQADGRPTPQNGPRVDNPPVMGPGATVHCSLHDWSKFVADMLRGLNGQPALMDASSYQTLIQTPPNAGEHGLGWLVLERPWADGIALQHMGSNTMNVATVWIAPKRDRAFLVCTNQGGPVAQQACDEAIVGLLQFAKLLP